MKTVKQIQEMLDQEVNVLLAHHGGRVDIIDIVTSNPDIPGMAIPPVARVTMSGGCKGCAGAKYTLSMIIDNKIKEFEPEIAMIFDITDHAAGTTPYYKNEADVNGADNE